VDKVNPNPGKPMVISRGQEQAMRQRFGDAHVDQALADGDVLVYDSGETGPLMTRRPPPRNRHERRKYKKMHNGRRGD
jgi:hypothetical protein